MRNVKNLMSRDWSIISTKQINDDSHWLSVIHFSTLAFGILIFKWQNWQSLFTEFHVKIATTSKHATKNVAPKSTVRHDHFKKSIIFWSQKKREVQIAQQTEQDRIHPSYRQPAGYDQNISINPIQRCVFFVVVVEQHSFAVISDSLTGANPFLFRLLFDLWYLCIT